MDADLARIYGVAIKTLNQAVKARLDTHGMAIVDILGRFLDIINPPESTLPEPPPKRIGFGVKERGIRYRTKRG